MRARLRRGLRSAGLAVLAAILLLVASLGGLYAAALLREDGDRHAEAPATGRFVPGGDVEIHLQTRGPPDGPVVVLIGGTGAWSGLWIETMEALAAEGHRPIALDLPPFGFSARPADGSYSPAAQGRRILAALDSLGVQDATIVGHSFGARAALEAVLADPTRFTRVVLVDAALDLDPDDEAPWLLRGTLSVRPVRDALAAATATNPLLTRTFLRQLMHNASAATDARVAILQAPLGQDGLTRDVGAWTREFLAPRPGERGPDRGALARMDLPVTLLWGDRDTVTPLEAAHALRRTMPGSTLVVLPEVGHIPHLEAPEAFQRALLAALPHPDRAHRAHPNPT